MHTVRSLTRLGALFAVLLMLGACRSTQPPVVSIQGTDNLNAGGNAATVRVYQLSNDTNFQGASLESFWRDDAAALGDELISSQSFLLYPETTEEFELDVSESARYIGVAVDLRQPDRERWRAIYPATDLEDRRILVTVDSTHLDLQVR